MNICRGCNSDFASIEAFDRHRAGKHAHTVLEGLRIEPLCENGRRCFDEDEMRTAGMELDPRGRWCIVARAERARKLGSRAETASERQRQLSVGDAAYPLPRRDYAAEEAA